MGQTEFKLISDTCHYTCTRINWLNITLCVLLFILIYTVLESRK